jgi:hypothetical protein
LVSGRWEHRRLALDGWESARGRRRERMAVGEDMVLLQPVLDR